MMIEAIILLCCVFAMFIVYIIMVLDIHHKTAFIRKKNLEKEYVEFKKINKQL